jgi:hypothetical protein
MGDLPDEIVDNDGADSLPDEIVPSAEQRLRNQYGKECDNSGDEYKTEGLFDMFRKKSNFPVDPAFSNAESVAQNEMNKLKQYSGASDKIIRKLTSDVANNVDMLIDDWKNGRSDDYVKLQFSVVPEPVTSDDNSRTTADFHYVPESVYIFNAELSPYTVNIIYGGKQYPDIPETEAYIGFVEPLQQYITQNAHDQEGEELSIIDQIRKYNIKGNRIVLKRNGKIGFELTSDLGDHNIIINLITYDLTKRKWVVGDWNEPSESSVIESIENIFDEDVFIEEISLGDGDNNQSQDTPPDTNNNGENSVTAAVRDKVSESQPDESTGDDDLSDGLEDDLSGTDDGTIDKGDIFSKLSNLTKNLEDIKKDIISNK